MNITVVTLIAIVRDVCMAERYKRYKYINQVEIFDSEIETMFEMKTNTERISSFKDVTKLFNEHKERPFNPKCSLLHGSVSKIGGKKILDQIEEALKNFKLISPSSLLIFKDDASIFTNVNLKLTPVLVIGSEKNNAYNVNFIYNLFEMALSCISASKFDDYYKNLKKGDYGKCLYILNALFGKTNQENAIMQKAFEYSEILRKKSNHNGIIFVDCAKERLFFMKTTNCGNTDHHQRILILPNEFLDVNAFLSLTLDTIAQFYQQSRYLELFDALWKELFCFKTSQCVSEQGEYFISSICHPIQKFKFFVHTILSLETIQYDANDVDQIIINSQIALFGRVLLLEYYCK